MVTVWWSAACLIHYSFLNPSEIITSEKCPQQIDKMHRKLLYLQQASVNRKGLILLHDNTWICRATNSSKVEWIGLRSFASSTTFTWPLANWLPLLQASRQLFAGKTLPQPAGGRKCFPKVHRIPKHGFLCYRNKQTYFSLAKNLLIVMVPILINKDEFEPSYNDLQFTVQNCSCVCTNLILSLDNATLYPALVYSWFSLP